MTGAAVFDRCSSRCFAWSWPSPPWSSRFPFARACKRVSRPSRRVCSAPIWRSTAASPSAKRTKRSSFHSAAISRAKSVFLHGVFSPQRQLAAGAGARHRRQVSLLRSAGNRAAIGNGGFSKAAPNALVDDNVMLQFNARVGDRIKIGEYEFRIAGRLRKIPGESLAFSVISPRVYIPIQYVDRTQLLQKGSLVRYRVFFKLDRKNRRRPAGRAGRAAIAALATASRYREPAHDIDRVVHGKSRPLSSARGVCRGAACRCRRGQRGARLRQRKSALGGLAALHRRGAEGDGFGLCRYRYCCSR